MHTGRLFRPVGVLYVADMKNLARLLVLWFMAVKCGNIAGAALPSVDLDSVFEVLENEIDSRDAYFMDKEQKLNILKESLYKSRDLRSRYDICSQIFDEYQFYQYDSAYVYANRMLDYACRINDRESMAQARIHILYCYISVGFYKEASETAQAIDLKGLSAETLVGYYTQMAHLHQNLGYYVESTDSLAKRYGNEFAFDNAMIQKYCKELQDTVLGMKLMRMRSFGGLSAEETIAGRLQLMKDFSLTDHEKAIQYYIISEEARRLGKIDHVVYYLALSVIHDIRGNIRETLSAATLAKQMLDDGKPDDALRYITMAQSDAEFYNTNIRELYIGNVISAIEDVRYLRSERQRYLSLSIMAVVVMSLIFIVGLYLGLKRKNNMLRHIRRELEVKNKAIDKANNELSQLNSALKEVNEIKERYIAQSLCSDQTFVNTTEDVCRTVLRKLRAKQEADVPGLLRQINIKKERRRIAEEFDSAFLALFPNFLEEFNKLFPEDARYCLTDDGLLPTEVKIYGLMRLGIDDTERVSRYLNISLNTIYVYKTRVKSRSIVPKSEFDSRIMDIPKP